VALYVSSSLGVKVLATSGSVYCGKPEYIIAEITAGPDRLLLATVYRPPKTGFLQEFENILLDLFTGYSNLAILGDFNANLCTSTYDSNHLREFLETSNLHLVPHNPTYHLENSSTWLNVCAVDDVDKLVSFGQSDVSFLSAHDLVYIEYMISIPGDAARHIRARDFRNFDNDRFLRDLSECSWNLMAETDCLDTKVEIFNALLTRVLDACAPFRSFTIKRNTSPWFTPDIKTLIVARNKARRTWRRRRTFVTYSIFRQLRNQTKLAIKAAKNAFYHRIFDNVRSYGETWSELRRLGLIRCKTQTSVLHVPPDVLNSYFTNIGYASTSAYQTKILDPDLGKSEYSDGKFYLTNPTEDELIRALSTSTTRSVGVDGLSFDDIKRAMPVIRDCIQHLFSYSILYEVFPSL